MSEPRPLTMLTVRIPEQLMQRLTIAAERHGQSRSEFLRDAITSAVNEMKDTP